MRELVGVRIIWNYISLMLIGILFGVFGSTIIYFF